MWKPPSEYPAYLHVTDIAGLQGAAEERELGNASFRTSRLSTASFTSYAFDSEEVKDVTTPWIL